MSARDLPLLKRIIFWISGTVYLEHRRREGWIGSNPFYLAKCPVHGFYEDYPHGFEGKLRCPVCGRYTIA